MESLTWNKATVNWDHSPYTNHDSSEVTVRSQWGHNNSSNTHHWHINVYENVVMTSPPRTGLAAYPSFDHGPHGTSAQWWTYQGRAQGHNMPQLNMWFHGKDRQKPHGHGYTLYYACLIPLFTSEENGESRNHHVWTNQHLSQGLKTS